jgi:hypothetical protein
MSDFDDWLTSNGKCRETASDLDEIQWLRMERQRLRSYLRWIPVSERLPEGSCRVLAWDGTRVSEVHFHPRAKQSEQWYSFAGHESPTHWMPLPEPPEVK